jgi:hypothetical protein
MNSGVSQFLAKNSLKAKFRNKLLLTSFILRFHVFGFVKASCPQRNAFGCNALTALLKDTPSEARSKLHVNLHTYLL